MYTYLIVDDEMIERKGIRMLLSRMNIRENILEASNGEEALEVFEKEKIDVLLTDINMPFMDGIELLSRIHEEYPGTETVIFSGYDNYFEQVNSEQIEKMQSDLQMPFHYLNLNPQQSILFFSEEPDGGWEAFGRKLYRYIREMWDPFSNSSGLTGFKI